MERWIPDLETPFARAERADDAADKAEPKYKLDTSLAEYHPPRLGATERCTWVCHGPRVHHGRIVDWVDRCRRMTADPSGLCWTHKRDRDRGAR
jgi:hypothetical protein